MSSERPNSAATRLAAATRSNQGAGLRPRRAFCLRAVALRVPLGRKGEFDSPYALPVTRDSLQPGGTYRRVAADEVVIFPTAIGVILVR